MAGSDENARPALALRLSNNSSFHSGSGMSPVTDLTFNLSGLSTSSLIDTPKRRISWSVCTPNRCILSSLESDQSFVDSPAQPDTPKTQDRLLKDVKCENSNQITKKAQTFTNPYQDKENIPSNASRKIKCLCNENNSFDSGYCSSQTEKSLSFFIEPSGLPPRRSKQEVNRNEKTDCQCVPSSSSQCTNSLFGNEDDDGFLDVFEIDKYNNYVDVPINMTNLLTKPLINPTLDDTTSINDENSYQQQSIEGRKKQSGIRRCLSLSLSSECDHPTKWKKQHSNSCDSINNTLNLTSSDNSVDDNNNGSCLTNSAKGTKLAFKRPEPPKDFCPIQSKRRKSVPIVPLIGNDSMVLSSKKAMLQRCHSETEATIMRALQKSAQEPDLIGDFSKPFALPLIKGKHQDLKTISPETVVNVLTGRYGHIIDDYTVVDCRYPYEFDAGHIKGARNIYSKEGVIECFLSNTNLIQKDKRHIIIFHCEFSSERGPALYRFLRNMDRKTNKDQYPLLHHPEIYVLHGGYKAFYENYKEHCEPQNYKPMLHKEHEQDLRHFRAKSKPSSSECKTRTAVRPGLKF